MIRRLIPLLLLLPLVGCDTPLINAIKEGKPETVKMLLDQGAAVNETVRFGLTPLIMAAFHGRRARIIEILLARGASIDQKSDPAHGSYTALMAAARNGHLENVRVLLDNGADTKLTNISGNTAAALAGGKRRHEIVQIIMKAARSPKKKRSTRVVRVLLDSELADIRAYTAAGDKAKKAGDKPTALKNYVAALREAPPGAEIERQLREKIIRLARSMKKPPPVPEDAKHHSLRAQAFLKMAKDNTGYEKAKEELEAALKVAPWWGDAYFNLGLVQGKLHDYKPAIENLKLYLSSTPNARDIGAIKKKIVELEVAQELAQ